MSEFLTMREAAEKLGVVPTRIKQLWAEHDLLKVMHEGKPSVPAECLIEDDYGWAPLPPLRGTMIMLLDAGFSTAEATDWIMSYQEELGERPIDSLRRQRIRDVRNAILPLTF